MKRSHNNQAGARFGLPNSPTTAQSLSESGIKGVILDY